MLEKHSDEFGHEMILVSRTGIIGFILFLLLMTGLLMALFMFVDFDSILGRKNFAMKVGQSSISLSDFKKIKEISGNRAKKMSDQTFAQELFETLLLAEDARNKMLDQNDSFRQKVEAFDAALNKSEDDERVVKSIFLIEELAKTAIEKLLKENPLPLTENSTESKQASEEVKLHLRTIKVSSASQAIELQAGIASGASFEELSASWSMSLYKSVGGDLGWKTEKDFPKGVFSRLLNYNGSGLIEGFSDGNDIHYFEILSKHNMRVGASENVQPDKNLRDAKSKIIFKHVVELRSKIDFWINPALQVMCQIPVQEDTSTLNANQ